MFVGIYWFSFKNLDSDVCTLLPSDNLGQFVGYTSILRVLLKVKCNVRKMTVM